MKDISELVKVDLSDILKRDFEQFLDLIAELAGHELLMGISYAVEGHEGNTLQIRVTGFVEEDEEGL